MWMVGRGQVKALDSSVARLGSEVIPTLTSLRERILLQSQDQVRKSLVLPSFVASSNHWSHLSNCNFLPMQDYINARQALTNRPYIQSVRCKLVRKMVATEDK